MAKRGSNRWARVLILAGAGTVALCARVHATEFTRGDVNGDRSVSVSDAHAIAAHLFWGARAPECEAAADVKEDGDVNLTDSIYLLNYLVLRGDPPPSPFPDPGSDPTPDLSCDAYGGGSTFDDPAAALGILDATAPGGREGRVSMTVVCSSSRELGGISGWIRPAVQLFEGDGVLEGDGSEGFKAAQVIDGSLRFVFLPGIVEDIRIPAGEEVPLVQIQVDLPPGTRAGEYALALEAGELIDAATSRAIHPALGSGRITVLSDVEAVEPPPPADAIEVEFRVGSAEAGEDRRAQVPFVLRANVPVGGYSFSLDFDEDILESTEIEQVWRKPDGSDYGFKVLRTNNDRNRPGNGGVDEGWILGAAIVDFQAPVTLPADTDNELFRLHFTVRPGSVTGVTEIRFMDGAQLPGSPPTENVISAFGKSHPPDLGSSYVFINGFVNVLPDGTLFIRGDSNGDGAVDLADARHTLGYLFQGGERPACHDAADANDDGGLSVTDPIATLGSLFLGTGPLPAPNGAAGEDPTPDGLGCVHRS